MNQTDLASVLDLAIQWPERYIVCPQGCKSHCGDFLEAENYSKVIQAARY